MGLASKLAASKQPQQAQAYPSSGGNYPPEQSFNNQQQQSQPPQQQQYGQEKTQYAPPTGPHPSQLQPGSSSANQQQGNNQQNYGQQQQPQQGQYQQQPQQGGQYGQNPNQGYNQQAQGQGQQQPQGNNPFNAPPPYNQEQSRPQQGQQQQQHALPPPPPQQQQQQMRSGGSADRDPGTILNIFKQAVVDQNITAFYPPGSLEQLASAVANSGAIARISAEWSIPLELGMDLCKLSLFDTILFIDDSGSMAFEEQGTRIDDLKLIVSRVAFAASLFDQDGIQVRFMNSKLEGNNITSESQALNLISQVRFSGLTPLGTELQKKVLDPLVVSKAKKNQLQKPVLIIVVTDGVPGGEDHHKIVKVILRANKDLSKTRYGSDAVSFQLSQVGNDLKARAFLEELDNHRDIGGLIDTTSNYENEADDMMKANPPVELTPELWLVKLLMGGIDSSYDSKDE